MAKAGNADELIARAEELGLRIEYQWGFLVVTPPAAAERRRGDIAEKEQEIVEQLGKCRAEIRALTIAIARAARCRELIGSRVLIPIVGIGETRKESWEGQVVRSQIVGQLIGCEDGRMAVSHIEIRDGEHIERTMTCAFDEAFIVVASDEPPASSFASIGNDRLRGALVRGQSIGLTLGLDTCLVVAKWNVTPADQEVGEEILREIGSPRGELLNLLEDRTRGAAGSNFAGQQVFVGDLDTFGILESSDVDGGFTVRYRSRDTDSVLTCHCPKGEDLLILAPGVAEPARVSLAEPASAPAPRNWFRRALGV